MRGYKRRMRNALIRGRSAAVWTLAAATTLAWGCGIAAAAGKPPPPPPPTPKDAAARLLTRSALGAGWRVSSAAPRKVPAIACSRMHLKLHGAAARPAPAASPTYMQTSDGPFVAETAYLYRTAGDAKQVWRGVARRALEACLAQTLEAGSAHGVSFAVVGERGLPAPRIRDATTAAYRISATATTSGQSADAYLDTVLIRSGAAVAELSFTTLVTPPSAGLERRLTGLAAARLDK